MISLLLAMYPAQWRRRYGEEFRAVLESRPLGPFDVADVLLGVLDARLSRFRLVGAITSNGGHLVMLRIGGFGAVLGGVAWVVGFVGAAAMGDASSNPFLPLSALGTAGILLALAGLSAFQAHKDPRLAWAAFAIPAIGSVLSIVGVVGMSLLPEDGLVLGSWSPWAVWMIGLVATLLGSVLFAAATVRAAVLSRPAAIALAVSAVSVMVIGFGLGGGEGGTALGWILIPLSIVAFGGSWVVLGITALRRGPIRADVPV